MEKPKRHTYHRERCLSRLPVTEAGERLIAIMSRYRTEVDAALALALTALGQYVDQQVRPLESGTRPPTPTPLADRAIRREIEQTLAEIADAERKAS